MGLATVPNKTVLVNWVLRQRLVDMPKDKRHNRTTSMLFEPSIKATWKPEGIPPQRAPTAVGLSTLDPTKARKWWTCVIVALMLVLVRPSFLPNSAAPEIFGVGNPKKLFFLHQGHWQLGGWLFVHSESVLALLFCLTLFGDLFLKQAGGVGWSCAQR